MLIIPAIDLKNGCCVRLSQGRMDKATVYSDDPVATARRFEAAGARRLHLVDLDGAIAGVPVNMRTIERIRTAVGIDIQIGGGIRSLGTVRQYMDIGITYVILGTAAVADPEFLNASCNAFPGRIIVGIDANNGMVAVKGWTETTMLRAVDVARQLDPHCVAAIVFTDISRDGMLSGINLQSTAELAAAVSIPVIASGGVASVEDIKRLLPLEPTGIMGVIIGRALYTGAVDLKHCLALAGDAASIQRH
ncbi:MAG: 1-(5-phosphoribosyl)-5-[(5-phosphoribosylamino)methylideneamino]imidazole-4-carboxamide isomerase [Desulfobacterota bacterium]|nr:1-(5-phosphoribosyl)-5-[(5-phosphoribosylamino)methylideneamino]imidazole-4-carboxamide isomerase [Thermodesulfobacteriota bacterium]